MKRIQWFVMSWCFMAFGIFLIYWDTAFNQIMIYGIGTISAGGVHFAVFDALVDMTIIISYFLFALFQILGWLEPKKK